MLKLIFVLDICHILLFHALNMSSKYVNWWNLAPVRFHFYHVSVVIVGSPQLNSYDIVYHIHSKLENHIQFCPLLDSYGIVYNINSKLNTVPSLYTYDMVYPIHGKLRNHTQFCMIRLFSSKLYMVVWDLCNTVIIYNEGHGIIRFMMTIAMTLHTIITID